jgi:hypothetical protein
VRRADGELSLAVAQVVDYGVNKLVNLPQYSDYVVKPGVRSVDEDSIGQPELAKAVETLHRRSVKNL